MLFSRFSSGVLIWIVVFMTGKKIQGEIQEEIGVVELSEADLNRFRASPQPGENAGGRHERERLKNQDEDQDVEGQLRGRFVDVFDGFCRFADVIFRSDLCGSRHGAFEERTEEIVGSVKIREDEND